MATGARRPGPGRRPRPTNPPRPPPCPPPPPYNPPPPPTEPVPWPPTVRVPDPHLPNVLYFPVVGHSLQGGFRTYWEAHGGLEQFGYPLTEEFWATPPGSLGPNYTTQYFERARFEWHPENKPPYDVLLGLLGTEVRTAVVTAPPPPPPPATIPASKCQAPALKDSGIYPSQCLTSGSWYWIGIRGF